MPIERPSRRELLLGGTAAALALVRPGQALAQQKELVANTYGGGWEACHRLGIAQPLEKRLGIKVTLISILAAELVARTKAASGGRSPVDVALVDDGPFLLAVKEGVFQQLSMDKIPNASRIYTKYRPKEPFGVPIGASQIGIAYNSKKLSGAAGVMGGPVEARVQRPSRAQHSRKYARHRDAALVCPSSRR
jgi:spermidine/putrescine-binding protein